VTLTKGFFLGKYEVTKGEYDMLAGKIINSNQRNRLPTNKENWKDAIEFCEKLTELERKENRLPEGWIYTLPTEAEWEYACRAGTQTAYSWGDEINSTHANYSETKINHHVKVGNYSPNPWGFFDMHGNVWEWCLDGRGKYPNGSIIDPHQVSEDSGRVCRGGSWWTDATNLRSANRGVFPLNTVDRVVGFRLCLKQFPAKKQASIAVEGKSWTVPSIGMEMMWCEPGTFMMGSPESEQGREGDETQHEVTLTEGFYLGKYEVTQEEYEKVMGGNPSTFKGKELPVEMVNWKDAMEFCSKLTELEKKEGRAPEGWKYVLPTEAQWEYACRADTTTVYSWGDEINLKMGNYNKSKLSDA
jgi:formylglycine-generating enzyme required for sulfatase activity